MEEGDSHGASGIRRSGRLLRGMGEFLLFFLSQLIHSVRRIMKMWMYSTEGSVDTFAHRSIGMLLGYHLLWSTTANVVGTPEQADRFQKLIIENNYFIGGAVNPRDSDLKISSSDTHITFNGSKYFNTGGVVSDLTVLEGVLDGTTDHIFAFVPTAQPGIVFAHNWNNIGLRLTESGGVKIENVKVPWGDALGWDEQRKRPVEEVLGIPFAALLLPTIQLVFSNFYLGIALGAVGFASKYTVKNTRAWPFGGDVSLPETLPGYRRLPGCDALLKSDLLIMRE